MANTVQIERMHKVISFLKDKSHLSNKEAAKALESIGEFVNAKYVQRLRNKKNSGLSSPDSIKEKINIDLKNGIKFNSSKDIEIKYNVTRGYANVLMKLINKRELDRVISKPHEPTLDPVPVTIMAFYVQQLTANYPGYKVASNG